MQPYKVPARQAEWEMTERRSRFIGQAWKVTSYEQVQQILEQLRREHYQARHVVYAVRLHRSDFARFSDDGEPQGTAGPPLLELLQRKDITDCLVTVVRYFGGILLGTGGLVRAYTQAGQGALQQAGEQWLVPAVQATIGCSYAAYGRVAALPSQYGGSVGQVEYTDGVSLPFCIPALCRDRFTASSVLRETEATLSQWQQAEPIAVAAEIFEQWKEKIL